MPINCKDFLSLANDSLERGDEIGYRNAISRAYYCAFHAIKSAIDFEAPKGKPTHETLINYLVSANKDEKIPYLKLRSLGYRLAAQRKLRSKSDYQLAETICEQEANEFLESTKLFLADIEEFIPLSDVSKPTPQQLANHSQ